MRKSLIDMATGRRRGSLWWFSLELLIAIPIRIEKNDFEGRGIEYSPLRFLCVHLQRFEFDYLDWLVFGVFFHFFCGKGNKKCNWIKSMAQYP